MLLRKRTLTGSTARTMLKALTCSLLWTLYPYDQAWAYKLFTVDAGYGMDDTRLLRLNLALGSDWRSAPDQGWYWTRYWEANFSYWYLNKLKNGEDDLLEIGVTPNFRLQREQAPGWGQPYFELGLGVHLLSKVHIRTRDLGSTFQFGTHAGIGVLLGEEYRYELAWRIEHLSNAGLKEPNPGINFSMVRFGYRW